MEPPAPVAGRAMIQRKQAVLSVVSGSARTFIWAAENVSALASYIRGKSKPAPVSETPGETGGELCPLHGMNL
jgi:hypothetical protein